MKCPNKSTIDWKRLENQCGPELAMTIWQAYGEQFPKTSSVSDLYRNIGISKKSFLSLIPRYNKDMRLYNKKNGTSHSLKFEQIGQSESMIVTIVPNYLPVNLEKQRQREYSRLEDTTSFNLLYPPVVTREEFLDDEFLAAQEDNEPSLISEKKLYVSNLQQRKKTLESMLVTAQAKKDNKKYLQLLDMIKKVSVMIADSKDDLTIHKVIAGWDSDEAYIKKLLSSDKVGEGEINLAFRILSYYSNKDLMFEFLSQEDIDDGSPTAQAIDIIAGKAIRMEEKLSKVALEIIKQRIQIATGREYTEDKIKELVEIDSMSALFRDASTNENILIQIADSFIKEAGFKTNKVLGLKYEEIEKIAKKVKNISPSFDIFLQKDDNGQYTGRLVHPYSQHFWSQRGKAFGTFNKNKTIASFKRLQEWKNKNVVEPDWRKLFYNDYLALNGTTVFTENEIEEHKKEIINLVGENEYATILKQLTAKKNIFLERRSIIENNVKYGLDSSEILGLWDIENSPFSYFDNHDNGIEYGGALVHFDWYRNLNYILTIPKKTIDGKSSGYYDASYQQISNNPDLYAFYNFFTETIDEMLEYLPEHVKEDIKGRSNFIPYLKKSIFEKITESNGSTAFKDVYEGIIEGLRDSEDSSVSYEERDAITNTIIPTLKAGMIKGTLTASDRIKIIQQLEKENLKPGTAPYAIRVKELEQNYLNEERSFQLDKVLKAFVTVVETYRHKAAVEDSIKMVDSILKKAIEVQTTSTGTPITDSQGNVIKTTNTLKNNMSQWEYAFDTFYGKYKNKIKSKRSLLTAEEKKEREYILNKINETQEDTSLSDEEKEQLLEQYEELLNNLGGKFVQSEMWDAAMKYIHMKSMGWNLFSAINNLMVGTMSNLIHSQGGQEFTSSEYFSAMKMLFSSVIKSSSLGAIETENAKKISSLMNRFSVLGTAQDELNQSNFYKSKLGKGINKLAPYEITKQVEYINQGATFIAMMMHDKIETPDGEKSLWECYDNEGNFLYDNEDDFYVKFKAKLEQVKKTIHGNYDPLSPVKIKKTVGGRALMMFRSWIAEGVASRFESERYDINLGRQTKGRWRSYAVVFNDDKFKDMSTIEKLIFNFKALIFKSTQEELSELDAANMRKNAMELAIWVAISVIMTALMSGDDDDDDEKRTAVTNYIMNLGFRLQTDIEFFISPIAAEKLIQQSVPPLQLVTDLAKFFEAVGKTAQGEDIIKTGPYAHESRLLRRTGKLLPGWSTWLRQESASKTIQE